MLGISRWGILTTAGPGGQLRDDQRGGREGLRDPDRRRPCRCWNSLPTWALEGLGAPPQGRFTAISVGEEFACASRDDGIVVCWGKTSGAMPPGGYGINELGLVYAVSAVRDDGKTTYIAVGDENSCQWQELAEDLSQQVLLGQPGRRAL